MDQLIYTPPYHHQAMWDFFTKRAIAGVEYCDDGYYQRTFEINNQVGIVTVQPAPTQAAFNVSIQYADASVSPIVQTRLQNLFDSSADIEAIESVFVDDEALSAEMSGMRVPGAWDFFEIGVRAILGQQITVAAARTLAGRLCQRFGRSLDLPELANQLRYLFPTADALAEADIAVIGMPQRRAECIRTLARAMADGVIEVNDQTDWTVLEKQLLALPGIGKWTVGYLRMRAGKNSDAFPSGDIALLNAARQLNIATTAKELEIAAQRWRPYRAYAVVRLWRSLAFLKNH